MLVLIISKKREKYFRSNSSIEKTWESITKAYRLIDDEAEVSDSMSDVYDDEESLGYSNVYEDPQLAEFLDKDWSEGDSDIEANRLMCIRKRQQEERGMNKQ